MDQTRAYLRQQVNAFVADPNVPDHFKIQFQNLAGMAYYNQGILSMTLAGNQTNTLSPFANMNSAINVDFHAFDGNPLVEAGPPNPEFRRFPMIIEVGGVQLIQAMLYTTQNIMGRYMTQRQAANVLRPFKNFVTTLREREGAMSCAGHSCNKSNIVILICKIESRDQQYVCGVPFCKGHARIRNKQILANKRIYLLGQEIMERLLGDGASDMDVEADQLMLEEDEEIREG